LKLMPRLKPRLKLRRRPWQSTVLLTQRCETCWTHGSGLVCRSRLDYICIPGARPRWQAPRWHYFRLGELLDCI
jgi:hypothetical protein